uniref:Uncharacterized protein n=1 Tax=Arundo donax TaxID=35708 RepID=A0A0A9GSI5_ARUDO
MAAARERIGV